MVICNYCFSFFDSYCFYLVENEVKGQNNFIKLYINVCELVKYF